MHALVFCRSEFKASEVRPREYLVRPPKKDSCVQVLGVKQIRVGRLKNIFILEFFFITNVQRLK